MNGEKMQIPHKQLFQIQFFHLGHSTMVVRSLVECHRQKLRIIVFMKGVDKISLPVRFMCNSYQVADRQEELKNDLKRISFYTANSVVGFVDTKELFISIDEKTMDEPTEIEEYNVIMRVYK